MLLAAIGVTILLALITSFGLFRYRRMSKTLAEHSTTLQHQQQELQNAYKQLKTISLTDSLTRLANRRHFDTTLAHEYQRYQRTGQPLANPPYLTLSIGVATVISGDPGIKEVFAQADAQLYIAKNMGRHLTTTFSAV